MKAETFRCRAPDATGAVVSVYYGRDGLDADARKLARRLAIYRCSAMRLTKCLSICGSPYFSNGRPPCLE